MKNYFSLLLIVLMMPILNFGQSKKELKIVSLSGAITEIVCALGYQNHIVGTDVTSTYPENLNTIDLGHVRTLSIESVLTLKPTLILATSKDLNPELLKKLKSSQIKLFVFDQELSLAGTKKLIEEVANAIGEKKFSHLQKDIDVYIKKIKKVSKKPKVLFVYARGAGTLMIAGKNTFFDNIIKLSGGQNAIQTIEDFKPLTPEALLQNNPDYILFFDKGLSSLGGIDGALKIEGIAKTNAGKNRNIKAMDGALLSGFGPRLGQAIFELNQLISK